MENAHKFKNPFPSIKYFHLIIVLLVFKLLLSDFFYSVYIYYLVVDKARKHVFFLTGTAHNCTPSLVHNYCTCIGAPYSDDCTGSIHQATKKTIHKQTSERRRKNMFFFLSQEPHTGHTITGALVHLTK